MGFPELSDSHLGAFRPAPIRFPPWLCYTWPFDQLSHSFGFRLLVDGRFGGFLLSSALRPAPTGGTPSVRLVVPLTASCTFTPKDTVYKPPGPLLKPHQRLLRFRRWWPPALARL